MCTSSAFESQQDNQGAPGAMVGSLLVKLTASGFKKPAEEEPVLAKVLMLNLTSRFDSFVNGAKWTRFL